MICFWRPMDRARSIDLDTYHFPSEDARNTGRFFWRNIGLDTYKSWSSISFLE
jgi:hypothetical protein